MPVCLSSRPDTGVTMSVKQKRRLKKCKKAGNKNIYDNLGHASWAVRNRWKRDRKHMRAYKCKYCNHYHLTSKPILGAPNTKRK